MVVFQYHYIDGETEREEIIDGQTDGRKEGMEGGKNKYFGGRPPAKCFSVYTHTNERKCFHYECCSILLFFK